MTIYNKKEGLRNKEENQGFPLVFFPLSDLETGVFYQ